jgi:hypothetical protein
MAASAATDRFGGDVIVSELLAGVHNINSSRTSNKKKV